MSAAVSFFGSRYQPEKAAGTTSIAHTGQEQAREWIEKVSIDELASYKTPAYQAPLQHGRTRLIAKDFDPDKLGLFEVAVMPDGVRLLNDGQHRVGAAKLSDNGALLVYAKCTRVESLQEAADIYLGINNRKTKPVGSMVMARAQSGERLAVEVFAAAEASGFEIDLLHVQGKSIQKNDVIRCPEKLMDIAQKFGVDHLSDVLLVVRQAWQGDSVSTQHDIVLGISQFLLAYPDVSKTELAKKLSRFLPQQLKAEISLARLSEKSSTAMRKGYGAGRGVLSVYNNSRKSSRLADAFDEFDSSRRSLIEKNRQAAGEASR